MSYYDSVYRDYELPSRASNVYRYLCDRANSDGQCWPSERTIAMDLKISRSTVKRAVEDLKRCGYITVERRYRKNGGNSSLLFVLKDFSKCRTNQRITMPIRWSMGGFTMNPQCEYNKRIYLYSGKRTIKRT